MKGYLVQAVDIRGHFCLGRVFLNKEKADEYCDYVNKELRNTHVDTAEDGHYFIYDAEVFQIELDEEVIETLQKQENTEK